MMFLVLITGCSLGTKTGTLELKLTDAPANFKIESAKVTLSSIEVHRANVGGNESSWKTVVRESQTFDLIELENVTTLLGKNDLEVGEYTQVRLFIDSAMVTVDGIEYNLDVPSEKLKLTKGFEIIEGETTKLTLDFDVKESIFQSKEGEFKLKPTIKIIQE